MKKVGIALLVFFFCVSAFTVYTSYKDIQAPVWLDSLKSLEGKIKEVEGQDSNPWIIEAYKLCELPTALHDDDKTSWCSAGLNKIMHDNGIKGTNNAKAKSWLTWGRKLWFPAKGAICIFDMGKYYHVTVLMSKEPILIKGVKHYWCIGCNQSGTIKTSRYPEDKLVDMRWPIK